MWKEEKCEVAVNREVKMSAEANEIPEIGMNDDDKTEEVMDDDRRRRSEKIDGGMKIRLRRLRWSVSLTALIP